MIDPKLLRGSLDTIILKLLDEHDEMYGYQITQLVKELTAGEMKLTEGALYPALHRLEGKGCIDSRVRASSLLRYAASAIGCASTIVLQRVARQKSITNWQPCRTSLPVLTSSLSPKSPKLCGIMMACGDLKLLIGER